MTIEPHGERPVALVAWATIAGTPQGALRVAVRMKQFAVGALLLTLALVILLGASLLVVAPDRPESTPALGVLPNPEDVFDPVRAGDPLPPGFRQLLPRDGILPIYDPEFVTAADSDWHDGALVIGLELEGESRAYPVGFLNRREMVIDSVAGIPVLVTW